MSRDRIDQAGQDAVMLPGKGGSVKRVIIGFSLVDAMNRKLLCDLLLEDCKIP